MCVFAEDNTELEQARDEWEALENIQPGDRQFPGSLLAQCSVTVRLCLNCCVSWIGVLYIMGWITTVSVRPGCSVVCVCQLSCVFSAQ